MKIKKLEWKKLDFWIAQTPAQRSGNISIAFEQGKYWPLWSCDLPGYDTLEEAMLEGQKFHDEFISQYLE